MGQLLSVGASILVSFLSGFIPRWMSEINHMEVQNVQLKLQTNEWNKNDERLLAAVEHGEAEKTASLLAKKGASAVKLDGEGKSALHVAAARGHTECLSVILSHGVDLSVADSGGFNPLHLAARNSHLDCCKKLIQSKCPTDATDGSGRTALHHAAASGNVQTIQLLCDLRSTVNLRDADGFSPLLCAAKHGHAEACAALLDRGADVNAADNTGRTALMLAAEAGAPSLAEVLVQRGADPYAVDSQGHDVGHYANMSGSQEVRGQLAAVLSRLQQIPDPKSSKSPQHDQVAKLSDERITTPKKRKAPPPPPLSPLQNSAPSSPLAVSSTGTPASNKSGTSQGFNYQQEEEGGGTALRGEVEKLQVERNMLLETIEDLKQTVETATLHPPGTQVEHSLTASAALVSALQAKITALTLENQQLAGKLKKQPAMQSSEEPKDGSRPSSLASNSSFHSTQDEFEGTAAPSTVAAALEAENGTVGQDDDGRRDEIRLLRQALESVQVKLLETRKENRSLKAQLLPDREESVREEELMESLAELQAKLTDTQERYHQAVEEAEELRAQVESQEGPRGGGGGLEGDVVTFRLEAEVKQLKEQLVQTGLARDEAARRVTQLEEALMRAEGERQGATEVAERNVQMDELYKEAQVEIQMLQEALRGTVPVEAAAKDFEEMKAELNEVISGLQRRLLELSHSYSETKSQLTAAQKQLSEERAEISATSSSEQQQQEVLQLRSQVTELRALLAEAEQQQAAAREEIAVLVREADTQAQSSVALEDHTRVMSSLGNAIKELESQSEGLKEQLRLKGLQVEALQSRLVAAEEDVATQDSVPREEHETLREELEGETSRLTQLLQGALRKQDEMALEAADAWQKARENSAQLEALQAKVAASEAEKQTLSSKLAESQNAVGQLKQLVENHVASEREKNKRIDDLTREVAKLKEALNSLSQLSFSSGSPSKRLQQNQQLETMQQQVKQLQYQLSETKKQHHEIVSVYRMHLLYAVQGQMDEDVQKALKQILMMCKVPGQTKDTC